MLQHLKHWESINGEITMPTMHHHHLADLGGGTSLSNSRRRTLWLVVLVTIQAVLYSSYHKYSIMPRILHVTTSIAAHTDFIFGLQLYGTLFFI